MKRALVQLSLALGIAAAASGSVLAYYFMSSDLDQRDQASSTETPAGYRSYEFSLARSSSKADPYRLLTDDPEFFSHYSSNGVPSFRNGYTYIFEADGASIGALEATLSRYSRVTRTSSGTDAPIHAHEPAPQTQVVSPAIQPPPQSSESPGPSSEVVGHRPRPNVSFPPPRSQARVTHSKLAPVRSLRPRARPEGPGPSSELEARVVQTTDCTNCSVRSETGLPQLPIQVSLRPKARPRIWPRQPDPAPQREAPRTITVRARDQDERRAQDAPIWSSFISNFAHCAPGCEPVGYSSWGRRSNRSCHPSGRAMDLRAMSCNGRTYRSESRGRFEELVRCMERRGMKALYFNGPHRTSGHRDHAHFSNGCTVSGRRIW